MLHNCLSYLYDSHVKGQRVMHLMAGNILKAEARDHNGIWLQFLCSGFLLTMAGLKSGSK